MSWSKSWVLTLLISLTLTSCKIFIKEPETSSSLDAVSDGQYDTKVLQTSLENVRLAFQRIVIFGDSLSDESWLYRSTLGLTPNRSYYRGRFSNGPLWTEYFRDGLRVPTLNLATGAATTVAKGSLIYVPLPGPLKISFPKPIDKSVEEHIRSRDFEPEGTLYFVWGGPNDFFGGEIDPEAVAGNIKTSVERLLKAGAKMIVVPRLIDLSKLPSNVPNTSRPSESVLSAASSLYNQSLSQKVDELRKLYPEALILNVDTETVINDIQDNPAILDLENTKDACYIGGFLVGTGGAEKIQCTDPDRYAFWDRVHPATRLHCAFAVNFLQAMQKEGLLSARAPASGLLDICKKLKGRGR